MLKRVTDHITVTFVKKIDSKAAVWRLLSREDLTSTVCVTFVQIDLGQPFTKRRKKKESQWNSERQSVRSSACSGCLVGERKKKRSDKWMFSATGASPVDVTQPHLQSLQLQPWREKKSASRKLIEKWRRFLCLYFLCWAAYKLLSGPWDKERPIKSSPWAHTARELSAICIGPHFLDSPPMKRDTWSAPVAWKW